MLTDLVNRHDMRMIDGCGGSTLLQKPLPGRGVTRTMGMHHLDGHVAPQVFVTAEINLAHTAAADIADDGVRADAAGHTSAFPGGCAGGTSTGRWR